MALHRLLERGMRETLAEAPGELAALVKTRALPEETAEHLRQTLEALPGLLLALDGALYSDSAPPHARTTFNAVVRYLLLEEDLIPTRGDEDVLVSLLDDVYLLHRAAQELRNHVAGVDFRSIDGGVDLLAHVLPAEIVRLLDDRLAEAIGDASE